MFTVLSRHVRSQTYHLNERYHDDEEIKVYMADHDTKTKEQFEDDWEQALNTIILHAFFQDVSQIVVAMKRKGWNIFLTSPVQVTY